MKRNEEFWRQDFPILNEKVNDEQLIYLDNAATTQKPVSVLQALETYYRTSNANVHRGVYALAERATEQYEEAREKVSRFIHATDITEVLFTRGTTTSLNWVARAYGESNLQPGDEIVLSYMEHHSNLIPWQQIAKQTGATVKYIELTEDGQLDMEDAVQKITSQTKIVALTHVSNVLGVVNPIRKLADITHKKGAIIVVDGRFTDCA